MPSWIGPWEIAIVVIIALLIFGPRKAARPRVCPWGNPSAGSRPASKRARTPSTASASMVIKILAEYQPGGGDRGLGFAGEDLQTRGVRGVQGPAQAHARPAVASSGPTSPSCAEAFGFVNLAVPGYEADDILATLARQAEAEGQRDRTSSPATGTPCSWPASTCSIMANTRGMTEVKIYDPAAVEERFGVPPRLIPDLIGLKGDTSDNIPGVPGIGEKTAAQLLAQFGGLEEVLAHVRRGERAPSAGSC